MGIVWLIGTTTSRTIGYVRVDRNRQWHGLIEDWNDDIDGDAVVELNHVINRYDHFILKGNGQ